jgi:predicted murein hydrolase (TIGR00659 family)
MTAALWLLVTVVVYAASRLLQARLGGHPLANPVLTSAAALLALLAWSHTTGDAYAAGGRPLLWMLGPATVALAVPLYEVRGELRSTLLPLAAALVVGSTVAVVSAMGLATLLGASPETVRSLAPKSVTTPIAMAVARVIGGAPSLAAIFVILTGSVGALTATGLFDRLGVTDVRARGFALGVAAHGMGTARAFQVSVDCGVYATLAMTLNGIVTSVVLPLLFR